MSVAPSSPRRFVAIDRDGTLNVEKHYLSDPDQLELVPGAGAAIAKLNRAGWGVVVVTNQSGIARGYFTMETLGTIHKRLEELLALDGAHIDGIEICPHGPEDQCDCRKPLPGMIESAARRFGFDPTQAFVIGDKAADVDMGLAVGATAILVRTGYGRKVEATTKAHFVVDDLPAAIDIVLNGK